MLIDRRGRAGCGSRLGMWSFWGWTAGEFQWWILIGNGHADVTGGGGMVVKECGMEGFMEWWWMEGMEGRNGMEWKE